MCDPLCSALTGSDTPTVTLQLLERDNLFIYPLTELLHGNYRIAIEMIAFGSIASKAVVYNTKAQFHKTVEICTLALQIAEERGCSSLPVLGSIYNELGMCYFYQGRYKEAEIELEKGIRQYQFIKTIQDLSFAYCFLARSKLQLGNLEGARSGLQQSLITAKKVGDFAAVELVLACQALFDLQTGDLPKAQRWAKECSSDLKPNVVLLEPVQITRITLRRPYALPGSRYADNTRTRGQ